MYLLPGFFSLAIILFVTIAPLYSLFNFSAKIDLIDILLNDYTIHVLLFTFLQATLSTIFSIIIAIPVARAFAKRNFFAKNFILRIFSVALVIPSIIAIFGIIAVHGKNGWINNFLSVFNLDAGYYLYGLIGILIGHTFFNFPFITRILVQAIESIPNEYWRLSSQLGLNSIQIFRYIEWPAIKKSLPGAASLVFILCFISFAVVLTLGGGPQSSTLEVAIFQALRFEYDIEKAVVLSILQFLSCGILIFLFLKLSFNTYFYATEKKIFIRPDSRSTLSFFVDAIVIIIALLLILMPLSAIFLKGFNIPVLLELVKKGTLVNPIKNTFFISISSAILTIALATGLIVTGKVLKIRLKKNYYGSLIESFSMMPIIFPPILLGTGIFILLKNYINIFEYSIFVVIIINSLMALPFVISILSPAIIKVSEEYDKLCRSIGLKGLERFRYIEWQGIRKALSFSIAIAITLSAGDLSAIALFGTENFSTLPMEIYRNLGAYRMPEAGVISMILLTFNVATFLLLERFIGGRENVRSQ